MLKQVARSVNKIPDVSHSPPLLELVEIRALERSDLDVYAAT